MGAWLLAVFGGLALAAGSRRHLRRVVVLGVTAHPRDGHSTGARRGHATGLHAGRPRWHAAGRRRASCSDWLEASPPRGSIASSFPGVSATDLPTFTADHRPAGHGGAGRLRHPGATGDPGQSDHGAPSRVRRASKSACGILDRSRALESAVSTSRRNSKTEYFGRLLPT